MKKILIWVATVFVLLHGTDAFSSDPNLTCYGYTSTTSHFACNISPYNSGNCTWWAAFMRPDLASAGITGDAGYWYTNASNLGFDVGLEPKVGAIAVFSSPGHVAHVESLSESGSFNVSEMDAYHSTGFTIGVNYATYYKGSGNTYHRNTNRGTNIQGSWTLKGFIYRRDHGTNLYCDSINSIWGVCWTPSRNDVSCQGGSNWTLYDFEQGSVIHVSSNGYCLEAGGTGGGSGSPDPNDPEPTSSDSDPDLHINSFDLKELGGSWVKEISKALYWGQSLQVEGRMEVTNNSSQEAHDVDSDYRVENKRDFDKDDAKIDEDSPFDIDPGEREEKSMSPVTIAVSSDGQTVTLFCGSRSKSFPVVNGFIKIYFFVDVEEDDGDHDISSESDKDEYGKVELIIRPPIIANFSASLFSGDTPLTVNFTDHSTNNPTSWSWNFGDGQYATGSNPSHTYSSSGIFTVSLTASNSLGTDSVTKVAYITVADVVVPPEPTITAPVLFRIVLVE